jgi:hypothetical protein
VEVEMALLDLELLIVAVVVVDMAVLAAVVVVMAVLVSSSSATWHKYSKNIRWLFVRSIIHKQDF